MVGKWIQVFSTGTHTDSNGNTRTWTKDDLDLIASTYDPKNHEAPHVIGHPKTNSPAYGWIDAVKREGNHLYVKTKSAVKEFVEMLKKGMFKKRSISINADGTLNHIGWLGAKAPAVKGLEDFQFSNEDKIVFYEFESQEDEDLVSEPAVEPTADPEPKAPTPNPSKEGNEKSPEQYEQEISTLSKKITTLESSVENFAQSDERRKTAETELGKLRLRMRKTEFETYLNEKIVYGSVSPAMEKKISKLLEVLDSVQFANGEEAQEFAFLDGEPEKPIDIFKSLIDDLPKQIEFAEKAKKKSQPVKLDDHKAIADAATEFVAEQKKLGKTVSFAFAVGQVTKNNK